jgi:hypothetical protein
MKVFGYIGHSTKLSKTPKLISKFFFLIRYNFKINIENLELRGAISSHLAKIDIDFQ